MDKATRSQKQSQRLNRKTPSLKGQQRYIQLRAAAYLELIMLQGIWVRSCWLAKPLKIVSRSINVNEMGARFLTPPFWVRMLLTEL